MPNLNEAREEHSSCIIRNTLYVLGGTYKEYRDIGWADSIEKLENINLTDPLAFSQWQLIQINSMFLPRYLCVACPLNEREMIIHGGVN